MCLSMRLGVTSNLLVSFLIVLFVPLLFFSGSRCLFKVLINDGVKDVIVER